MIAFRRSVILVSNTVDKNHQDSNRDEEQCSHREWIYPNSDLEPGIPRWEPVQD